MNSPKRPLTYQKILFSKFVGVPLAAMVGFAGGVACAGQVWLKSGFEVVPSEIVLAPPPRPATWCFPDVGFTEAEKFRKELTKQMTAVCSAQYNDSIMHHSIQAVAQKDRLAGQGYYQLHLLAVTPQQFAVVALSHWETDPSSYTLITEQGYFYLHTIPKRRHEKYDSLVSARLSYRD